MTNCVHRHKPRFTYADYKDWELKPGERYELIDGIAYAMAAPNIRHQRISMYLSREFSTFLRGKRWEAFAAPVDVRLFYEADESDETVVQPDLIVVCDPRKLGEEGCRGAPDIVVEILSSSNTAIEMERKLNLYKDAGVREYWIVDPKNKHIRAYILKNGQYIMRTFYLDETAVSEALPGLKIPLANMFAENTDK